MYLFADHTSEKLTCLYLCLVIRASVPKLELDSVFEQKNEIAKAVEQELEKVFLCLLNWFGTSQVT